MHSTGGFLSPLSLAGGGRKKKLLNRNSMRKLILPIHFLRTRYELTCVRVRVLSPHVFDERELGGDGRRLGDKVTHERLPFI